MNHKQQEMSARIVPTLDAKVTRRGFLRGAAVAGLGVALGAPLLSLATGCSSDGDGNGNVKMGITMGNQTLWRYLASKKDQLLKPLGYNVTFANYQNDDQLFADFVGGKIDVCATIVNSLPSLSATSDVQLFLPIAWMKTGFPIMAPAASSLRSVADLQGKRLAILSASHPSTLYWEALVRENYGFSLKEKANVADLATLQAANPVDPLRDGKADAAVMESSALTELLPAGAYRQIGDLRTEWIKVSRSDRLLVYGGYAAKSQWLKTHDRFAEDLIRVNYEALKAFKADRASFIDAATAYGGDNAPRMSKESSAYIADYLGYDDVEAERVYLSSVDAEDFRKLMALFAKVDILKAPAPDVANYFYLSGKRPK
ncbi:MAG: twin-arginine translocation signal domain-containing protein [Dehalococcoidia bacterium]|nr:twin-arginine translocation signal domain-containing protein [Dehalococcoidia bacterium]